MNSTSKEHIEKVCNDHPLSHSIDLFTSVKIYSETPIFPNIKTEERGDRIVYETLVRKLNENGKWILIYCKEQGHIMGEASKMGSLKRAVSFFYQIQHLYDSKDTSVSKYGFPPHIPDENQNQESVRLRNLIPK